MFEAKTANFNAETFIDILGFEVKRTEHLSSVKFRGSSLRAPCSEILQAGQVHNCCFHRPQDILNIQSIRAHCRPHLKIEERLLIGGDMRCKYT